MGLTIKGALLPRGTPNIFPDDFPPTSPIISVSPGTPGLHLYWIQVWNIIDESNYLLLNHFGESRTNNC